MKKIVKTASPEPKEEAQEILNYTDKLDEIVNLLKEINIKLDKLNFTGGF